MSTAISTCPNRRWTSPQSVETAHPQAPPATRHQAMPPVRTLAGRSCTGVTHSSEKLQDRGLSPLPRQRFASARQFRPTRRTPPTRPARPPRRGRLLSTPETACESHWCYRSARLARLPIGSPYIAHTSRTGFGWRPAPGLRWYSLSDDFGSRGHQRFHTAPKVIRHFPRRAPTVRARAVFIDNH